MHVQDAADGLVELLSSDAQSDFNIASNRPVNLRQIVQTIGAKIGRPELINLGAIEKRDNDAPVVAADTDKIKTAIGWRPKIELDAGLDQTIQWWRSQLNCQTHG